MWSETNDEGIHDLCHEPAVFTVPVEYDTAEGMKSDRVALCTTHTLMASREGIAKR